MPEYANIRQRTTKAQEAQQECTTEEMAANRPGSEGNGHTGCSCPSGEVVPLPNLSGLRLIYKELKPQYHSHTPRTSERCAWYGCTLAQSSPQDHTHLQKAEEKAELNPEPQRCSKLL